MAKALKTKAGNPQIGFYEAPKLFPTFLEARANE